MESDPAKRNVFGLIAAEPELARGGIRLRKFGQEIIAALGGQKIHPAWSVPGGVRSPLTEEDRDAIRAALPEAAAIAHAALERFKRLLDDFQEEISTFGNFPTLHMGLVTEAGNWEHYDGPLRFVDADGTIVADRLDASNYRLFLGEAVQPSSFLKSPYYRPLGYPQGIYRVGPLSRLNVCQRMNVPLADVELLEYRQRGGRTVNASFYYHYARLIEIIAAIETIERMLDDPDLRSGHLRAARA